MINELRDCPFCGGRAVLHKEKGDRHDVFIFVECSGCLVRTRPIAHQQYAQFAIKNTEEFVINFWNRRAKIENISVKALWERRETLIRRSNLVYYRRVMNADADKRGCAKERCRKILDYADKQIEKINKMLWRLKDGKKQ
jgi:Lar family restriction alleviation protein